MNSIRWRLMVALLLSVMLSWAVWFGWQTWQMNRERTGFWDASLGDIANQILHSMPDSIVLLREAPIEMAAPDGAGDRKMSFQVWVGDRNVVHSPDAPARPMKPDFRDGFASRRIGGDLWRVYSVSDPQRGFHVQVGRTRTTMDRELHGWLHLSLAGAAFVFALLGFAVWGVVRWSLAPVTALRTDLQSRRPLDPTPLPASAMPAEVRPLVQAFNGLLARVDEAVQNERRFTADAAHELRTPLAVLAAQADVALRAPTLQEKDDALRRLSGAVQRSARLSEQLLDTARLEADAGTVEFVHVDLPALLMIVVRDFETLAHERGQRISLHTEPGTIIGDVDLLGILLRNLIDNAVRYAGDGARISASCRPVQADGVDGMLLSVSDSGPGVSEADRPRIFERFYRGAGSAGRGSGIGLSLVMRIAQSHHASIQLGQGLEGRGLGISVLFASA